MGFFTRQLFSFLKKAKKKPTKLNLLLNSSGIRTKKKSYFKEIVITKKGPIG